MLAAQLPPIYVINLERSVERRERMHARLSERGLSYVRVEGVDGRDGKQLAHVLRSRAPTPAEAGCIAAHLRAVKTAFQRGDRLALVLEDDVTFEPFDAWPGGLAAICAALPDPFSVCALSAAQTPRRLDALFRGRALVEPLGRRHFWSLGAMLYHRRGMQLLLSRYDRGDHFDVRDFTAGRHDAYQLLHRSFTGEHGLPGPFVGRIPLFLFEGLDSEIHPAHLAEHGRALAFLKRHVPELIAGTYRSPFALTALWSRLAGRG